jgi:hypothetical protein
MAGMACRNSFCPPRIQLPPAAWQGNQTSLALQIVGDLAIH